MKRQIIISLLCISCASTMMADVTATPPASYIQTQQQAYQTIVQQYQQAQTNYVSTNSLNPSSYNLSVQPASGSQPTPNAGS